MDDITTTRRSLIKLYQQKVTDGSIKAMESRHLMELLAQEQAEEVKPNPLPGLKEPLPFQTDELIVGPLPS